MRHFWPFFRGRFEQLFPTGRDAQLVIRDRLPLGTLNKSYLYLRQRPTHVWGGRVTLVSPEYSWVPTMVVLVSP